MRVKLDNFRIEIESEEKAEAFINALEELCKQYATADDKFRFSYEEDK